MATITIPDDLADRLRQRAEENGQDLNAYAISLLLADREAEEDDEEPELDEETIAALNEGLADMRAGRTYTVEEVIAHSDAALDAYFAAKSK